MLEEQLKIEIEEIRDWNELTEINFHGNEILDPSNESNYLKAWKWRHDYEKAGISDANICALIYKIHFELSLSLEWHEVEVIMTKYFIQEFQKKNVLKLCVNRDDEERIISFFALIYPLRGRQLDAHKWEYNGKILNDKYKEFIDYIKVELGIKEKVTEANKYIKDDANKSEDLRISYYNASNNLGTIQTDAPYDDMVDKCKEILIYYKSIEHRLYDKARFGLVHPKKFLEHVEDYVKKTYLKLTHRDIAFIQQYMYNAVYEYAELEPLINDHAISDIKVIAPDNIRVKVKGKRCTSNITFSDDRDYCNFVDSVATRNGLKLQETPMCHFVDKRSNENYILRFNIITPYVGSSDTPYLQIRKIAKNKPTINDLIKDGMLTKELAEWFIRKAKESTGILFVGKGGSGKTTMMNVLLEYVPFDRSIMICQDNEEMFTDNHPDVILTHTVESQNPFGHSDFPTYSLKDITKNGLLIDIDYFIIGEIKGAEAMYFLNASMTGAHCWASLHSSVATLDKLADYVMYESKYNREQALYMLKNIQYIVHMDGYKIQEIARTGDWNKDINNLEYTTVYHREKNINALD